MLYLVLSVFFSTSLFVIFKYFDVYKIDTLKAIVVNYLVAFALGFLLTDSQVPIKSLPSEPWFFGAMLLGFLFVLVFFVMALTAQKNGVSVASVASKMSVVIPIVFGVWLYNESLSFFKVIGIIMALVAVYLSSYKVSKKEGLTKVKLLFPAFLFLGSGTIDTLLKYIENHFVKTEDVAIFSGSLFGFAAFFGLIILFVKLLRNREGFGLKNLIAGVVLGVPNYYSIVFLIKALQHGGFESSSLFTVNNLAIVLLSTSVGFFMFKETFSTQNKVGIFLAIVAIILVASA